MYENFNFKLLFKSAWLLIFILPILLCMDYFLYWQLRALPDDDMYVDIVRNVQWIAVSATIACMLLVAVVVIVTMQKANQLKQLQYSDELIRRFYVPINSMIGISNLLAKDESLTRKQQLAVKSIEDSGQRIKGFMRDMDEYSRLSKGLVSLNSHAFSLHDIVQAVVDRIDSISAKKDIILINSVPKSITVNVDSARAQEIVENIIVTLINYTRRGSITVSAKTKGIYAEIKVVDDGVGINRRTKRIMFEPVYGANNMSNGHYSGTGFSMAIVNKLVKLHRGKVWIGGSDDRPVTVTFTLLRDDYLLRVPVKKINKISYLRDMGTRMDMQLNDYSDKRILLLKLESAHKNTLLYLLQQARFNVDAPNIENYNVDQYNLTESYDLVLIDELFGDDGFNICQRIREKYNFVEMPVLMMMPNDRQANLERAYRVGVNDCIDYLVMPQQLIAKVKTLIQVKTASEEVLTSQMQMLQSQIQPHFLYNALNVITHLCLVDPQRAHDTLLDFSQCLRSKFQYWRSNHAISVAEELEIIESYLRVEQARFSERLRYNISVEEKVKVFKIPALIIEPLVENAVKHGVSKSETGGVVGLTIEIKDDSLVVTVTDNGNGMSNTRLTAIVNKNLSELGTGVGNVIRRLKIYNGSITNVKSTLGQGTEITFSIPINWNQNFNKEDVA